MRGWRETRVKPGHALGLVAAAMLAACTAQDGGQAGISAGPAPAASPVADTRFGTPRTDIATLSMAGQYSHPRAGRVAATGASAWVAPALAPAFVASGPLPPADPPAPPPAAVANRQPSSPAAPASDIVRPEAAAEAPEPAAAASPNPAVRTRGLALFNDYSCNACHALADARSAGGVGPALDGNPNLTKDYVISTVTTGRGAMPSFGGQMSDEDMAALADYIVQFARK